jgi:acetamidase/formamidase
MRLVPLACLLALLAVGCAAPDADPDDAPEAASPPGQDAAARTVPEPDYTLTREQTHNRFSRAIEPVLRVPSGAVIEALTEEASDGQITAESTVADVEALDFDPIHPLTGPVYVEGAQPGDVLAVTLHAVELGAYGWTAVVPGFGFLADEFPEPYLKTFTFEDGQTHADFGGGIRIPLRPFPGVMGVAPDTAAMLSTIPPRANGGNMDDPHLTAGTTAYFPVFVEGALFSIGDAHATQGAGEVCGTAIEAPTRIVYELRLIQGGRAIREPEYETADAYAVTAFGTTLDAAATKANRYMIDYLVAEHAMDRYDAYALTSLAGDLKIAEVVDVPHVLVSMHMPKAVLPSGAE